MLTAALTVYGEVGWAGFTLDAVARRAPVGEAALYRRWPTREALLLAALERLAELPDEDVDLTDLRGCLTAIAGQVIGMYVGPKAMVLPRISPPGRSTTSPPGNHPPPRPGWIGERAGSTKPASGQRSSRLRCSAWSGPGAWPR